MQNFNEPETLFGARLIQDHKLRSHRNIADIYNEINYGALTIIKLSIAEYQHIKNLRDKVS